ncbi:MULTISPECIES: MFS transporter [Bacillales]|uniref:MFS transporter n=1 Tax=Bacillales TaxID=1385 RepID=UPI0009A629A2|nr:MULTISPECIES: MFS transporter [Bacillales]
MSNQIKNNYSEQNHDSNKLLIVVLALSVLMAAITVDMVTPVLGMIGTDLGGSEAQVSWVVSGVALVLAIAIPFYGRMSDFLEVKKLFTIGILTLTIGSLICALAPNLSILVFGRMVQGAGMASIPVLSVVVVSKIYPPGQRGSVLGVIAGSIGIGTAGGPIFGGIIGQWLGWHSLFWIVFCLGLLIAIGAQISMQKMVPTDIEEPKTFDIVGGILLGLTVGLLLLGITLSETYGFGSYPTIVSLTISLCALIALIFRTATAKQPFIPPVLLKNHLYVSSVLIVFFSMFAYFSILVFVPLLVVEVNGLTPGEAGMTLLPGGAAVAILSPMVGKLSDRVNPKILLITGLAVMGISTLFMSVFAGFSPIFFSIGVLGIGVAFALINSPANNITVAALSKEQVGVGMGLFQGALYLGAGTGAALIGALLSARREVGSALNPLYRLSAPHYSDIFLVVTIITAIALVITSTLNQKS